MKLTKKTFKPNIQLEVINGVVNNPFLSKSHFPKTTQLEGWKDTRIGTHSLNNGIVIPVGTRVETIRKINNDGSSLVEYKIVGQETLYVSYWLDFKTLTKLI